MHTPHFQASSQRVLDGDNRIKRPAHRLHRLSP
jgi:hypothetical protein